MLYKESLYQSIVDNMTNGYACFRAIADENGVRADCEVVRANPAFEELVGLKAADLIGKTFREACSRLMPGNLDISRVFDHISKEGSRESFEQYSKELGKWFWVYIYSLNPEYFVLMLTDITLLKKTEENLRKSEAIWKFALEGSGDGVWDWDYTGQCIFYSRQWKAMLGYSNDEISSKLDEWESRLHPDDRAEVYEVLERHLAGITPYYISEHRLRCKDGSYKWVLDRGMVVSRDREGKPLRIIGTKSDITERKRIETTLHEQEQNLRTFFNTIDEFLFVLDKQGRIKKANQIVLDRLGYELDELGDQSFLMLHPEDRRAEAEIVLAYILEGCEKSSSIPLLGKNGTIIPVETRAVKGKWSGEEVIFAVSKDLSSITLSEEKYSRAFHGNASLMSISTIKEGRYLDVNQSFCEKLGYQREEIIGHTSLELGFLWSPTERKEVIEWIMREGRVRDYEIDICTRSGEKLVGMISIDLIRIQFEDYLLIMINDITQRRRMAEELEKKNQQLEEINEILKLQAVSDSLTQLFNHRYVMESLQSEIERARRYHQPLTIMMMDLDHFKRVNDNYGHQVGDEVLQATAEIIRNNLRNIDVAGRYGGEEFVVILPQTDLKNSLQVAERIRLQIEKADFNQPDLKITISIGITEYEEDELESLIKRVDKLLYQAKNNGRNRIESREKME